MASFNKVILMGNLTRDPEMRVTANGLAICKLGLAVNRSYKTREGERREETTFVDIDAFDKQAEVISKYMSKEARSLWRDGSSLTNGKVTDRSVQLQQCSIDLNSWVDHATRNKAVGTNKARPLLATRHPLPRPKIPAIPLGLDEEVPF